jgi:hypothetical protein
MVSYDHYAADDEWATINGVEVDDDAESSTVRDWLLDDFQWNETCPFCRIRLVLAAADKNARADVKDVEMQMGVQVGVCTRCSYWQIYASAFSGGGPSFVEWQAYVANARTFRDVLPPGCESELAQALRRDPKRWHKLTPRRLEQLVTDIFSANYKTSRALHVGRPNDEGVDVLYVDCDADEWLIQVKCRESASATEGVEVLRTLLGTMTDKDVPRGIMVSTADHFSAQALRFAERNTRKGRLIRLVDRHVLDQMLSPLLPQQPWNKPLSNVAEPPMLRSLQKTLTAQLAASLPPNG